MAYSDYGAFVYCNGERRRDKEDVALFATDDETFGTQSENVPSALRIFVSLMRKNENGEKYDWVTAIHHGIMGDGPIRVLCHKQGRPQIYELKENGEIEKIEYCREDTPYYDFGYIFYTYKGYKFDFESGKPYKASMEEPNGTKWICQYDYCYGAGFESDESRGK